MSKTKVKASPLFGFFRTVARELGKAGLQAPAGAALGIVEAVLQTTELVGEHLPDSVKKVGAGAVQWAKDSVQSAKEGLTEDTDEEASEEAPQTEEEDAPEKALNIPA